MGSIALASPFVSLTDSLVVPNQALTSLGSAITPYKYSGGFIDFALDTTGNPTVGTFSSVPTDAVAVELWVNANGASDYLFANTASGVLSATGVIGTNITANLAAVRSVASGAHMTVPFVTVGTVPTTLRFAGGVSGARCQGRYISQSSGFPYLLGSTTQFQLTGAGAQQQMPFNSAGIFPVGYAGAWFQVIGSGAARFTIDGTATSATLGDILPLGTYYIDQAKHGISLAALRIWLPTGVNIIGNSLVTA